VDIDRDNIPHNPYNSHPQNHARRERGKTICRMLMRRLPVVPLLHISHRVL
jgi:hypothetical protein